MTLKLRIIMGVWGGEGQEKLRNGKVWCVWNGSNLGLLLLLFVKLALVLGGGLLVLLVLGHQVVHVRLGLSEFHLIHTLAWEKNTRTTVPVQIFSITEIIFGKTNTLRYSQNTELYSLAAATGERMKE